MKLDRSLQRKILTGLAAVYPRSPSYAEYDEIAEGVDEDVFDANLYYLAQHGLVAECMSFAMSGEILINMGKLACTAQGMDFLAGDGGLSAILGTVTVKLHEDTLRQLIEAKVKASDAPEDQKTGILKALREAPGDAIKHLTEKLLDLGLENAPKAFPIIQTLLQSGHS
ncbi:hypothetical protein SAMN04490182_4585 [Pseudomonas cedrina]|uniref:Uncharacterized protein n=2 Tax=Pseudomonas cedrina TaxID=651740 RepID=A0A1V2K4Z5_PSECE|nr:hypothetical protein [Pseudomonas cedrina]ONH52783.1 hypothetical protein BLL36_18075 [Pseudomonas cedrina subsp. cedrina]SDT42597.1 hypothetical protein SAMN04490182_4585 [Pseudomonas cedrina]